MEFRINTREFVSALSLVSQVVLAKTPKEQLKGVLIDVGDIVTLTTSDIETQVSINVHANSDSSFRLLVDCRKLRQAVATIKEEEITVSVSESDENATIRTARNKFVIPTMKHEEFPLFDDVDGDDHFTASQSLVSSALDKVSICCREESSGSYVFSGVSIQPSGESVCFFATDGRRAGLFKLKPDGDFRWDSSPIIPVKAAKAASGLFKDGVDVTLKCNESQISMSSGEAKVCCRLLQGRMPVHTNMDSDYEFSMSVPVSAFHSCVNQASVMASEESGQMSLVFNGDAIDFSCETSGLGSAVSSLPIEKSIDCGEVLLDPKYILQGLSKFSDDAIEIQWSNDGPQVSFSQGSFQYIAARMQRN